MKKKNIPRISSEYAELPYGYIEHEHDGFTYCLPRPMQNKGMTFDELEIVFQLLDKEESVGSENECHDFVAIDTDGRYEMVLHLCDVDVPEEKELQYPLTGYLYRKDRPTPLCCMEMKPEDKDYSQVVNHLQFTPGEYFVLVNGAVAGNNCFFETEEMAGMSTFHFTIKEHGRNLPHPKLAYRQVEELPMLELSADEGRLVERDVYRYTCYNSVYRRTYTHHCRIDDGKMYMTLMDIRWPVDDIYTVVLYHNNEPIMAYRYTLIDKQVHHLTATPLSPGGPIYTLATTIEKALLSSYFTLEPGFKDVKDYLLNVLSGHEDKGNLMVACEKEPSYEFVVFLMDTLHGLDNYLTLDASDLIAAWRETGKSCLKRLLDKDGIRLTNLSVLLHPAYQELLTALDKYIGEGKRCFYLFENTENVATLLKRLDCAEKHFPASHRLLVPEFEPAEIVYIIFSKLMESSYSLHPVSLSQLTLLIYQNEDLYRELSCDDLGNWVNVTVIPYIEKEYADTDDDAEDEYSFGYKEVNVDFTRIALPEKPATTMDECLAELNAMVGLDNLKTRLKSLFNRTKFDNMRIRQGLAPLNENRQHMIFTGNPGTGKTTVARIMGKVFKQLGVLSEGQVITAERADMVGKYIGHTEDTMKDLLEKAKGNVLFIDEAYSLCDNTRGDRTDYGNRVIESLLGVLAKNDSDIIVIMAGYEKQMKQMLEMNPGMRGRFVHTFNFEDYNSDELLQICVNKLHSKDFSVDEPVQAVMKECIDRTVAAKDELFHNARWAEQFVMQGIVTAMADRLCLEERMLSPTELSTVIAADVLAGYDLTQPEKKKERRCPGFHSY